MSAAICFSQVAATRYPSFSFTSENRQQMREKVELNTGSSSLQERLFALVDQVRGSGSPITDPAAAQIRLSDLGVSSLKMVNLMLTLELEFDIAIPQNEITPENFLSVSAIASMLDRLLPVLRK